jgi:MAM domain, meprin/A5/mu
MRVNSFGRYGDRIALTSPKPPEHEQADDGKTKILEFQYYIVEEAANTGGSLEVYVLSEEKVPIVKLMRKEDNTYNTWITKKCPLPTEKLVYIMFVATLGLPFISDVMIDNVIIKADDESSLGKQLGRNSVAYRIRVLHRSVAVLDAKF